MMASHLWNAWVIVWGTGTQTATPFVDLSVDERYNCETTGVMDDVSATAESSNQN
jgi:hypothetical protein